MEETTASVPEDNTSNPTPEVEVSEVEVEQTEPEECISTKSDTDAILGAVKELTKQVAENTKVLNAVKDQHEKWVRSGKF